MSDYRETRNGGQKKLARIKEPDRKAKRKSRLTGKQKILLSVAIVLAVVLAVTLAYRAVFVKPELSQKDPVSFVEEIDYGDGIRPRSDGERKSKDYYTVLVMGRDTGGGGNTDTMMLASYDVTNQKLTVMNIPRDTMVNVSWDIKRINSVYNFYGGGDKGVQKVYQEVSQLVGFEPDYQVIVEWDAVGKLVDAIGGVYFDVPRNVNYDDPCQNLSIHIDKGYQLLDGEQAMGVIRYRHDNNMKYGYANGDLGRIQTQQAFLKAVIQQLLQVKNVGKISEFAKIFEENVETDLSVQNLFWFGKSAIMGGLTMDNVEFVTMPNTPKSCYSRVYHNYQSYVVPNATELLELVNDKLSPFVETFKLSDLDIMSVNSDGSVSSSTGHVEDSKAAFAPVIPSNTSTEPVEEENGETEPGETDIDPETGLPATPEDGQTATDPPVTDPSVTDPATTPATDGTGGTADGTTDPSATTPAAGETGGDSSATAPGTQTTTPDDSVIVPPEVTTAPDAAAGT
ncbi:putative LytR family regulatory protein [Oscillibacter valericigenes Sjm18-20]|nr:putative LytR family regulatory protein [Oscillibacter valericigenes Sjm18-20]